MFDEGIGRAPEVQENSRLGRESEALEDGLEAGALRELVDCVADRVAA